MRWNERKDHYPVFAILIFDEIGSGLPFLRSAYDDNNFGREEYHTDQLLFLSCTYIIHKFLTARNLNR
jgi:hypothetical protein